MRRTRNYVFIATLVLAAIAGYGCGAIADAFKGSSVPPVFSTDPNVTVDQRIASAKETFTTVLDELTELRVAGFINDDQQRAIAKARDATDTAIQTASRFKDVGGKPLADSLQQIRDELQKLIQARDQAKLLKQQASIQQPVMAAIDPVTGGFLIIGALIRVLQLANQKASQAAKEGRPMTQREIDEIDAEYQRSLNANRAVDPPSDGNTV